LPLYLGAAHAEDRAVEVDVLAPGQLGVEPGADLEQRADASADVDIALGRLRDPREDLQERRLAGAVTADDSRRNTLRNLEVEVVERPHPLALLAAQPAGDLRVQRLDALQPVALREPDALDRELRHQKRSTTVRSLRRNANSPTPVTTTMKPSVPATAPT